MEIFTGKKESIIRMAGMLALLLFLGACSTHTGPHPYGSGYMYHSCLYKAPPGPELLVKKKADHPAPVSSSAPVSSADYDLGSAAVPVPDPSGEMCTCPCACPAAAASVVAPLPVDPVGSVPLPVTPAYN